MRYTKKLTLEVKMKDFYKMAIPLVGKKELSIAIKSELSQCCSGMIDGDYGGMATDWLNSFYYNLWKDGYITQTEKCISRYGIFKK